MAAKCPVCHKLIPWPRMFRTSAWGSWRCEDCNSLLTVNVVRRFVALGVAVVAVFLVTRFVRVGPAGDLPLVLIVMGSVMLPYFLCFEQARVLERRGFRCHGCGYDLRGQIVAHCPECGRAFDDEEVARMKRPYMEPPTTPLASRNAALLAMLIVLFAGTVLLVIGTARYRNFPAAPTTPATAPPPADGGSAASVQLEPVAARNAALQADYRAYRKSRGTQVLQQRECRLSVRRLLC